VTTEQFTVDVLLRLHSVLFRTTSSVTWTHEHNM